MAVTKSGNASTIDVFRGGGTILLHRTYHLGQGRWDRMDRDEPDSGIKGDVVPQQQVDPIIGDAVGGQLKSLFDSFASEAVPDRFVELIDRLEKLEEIEAQAASSASADGDER
jgi:hypothetical protein